MVQLTCDYLVIGAGAASLAFVDTLLTEIPTAKIILVDKNPCPGGHWVNSYDFVHLQHSSIVYGVASRQLEGNWLKLLLTKFTFPWSHFASKKEILKDFGDFIKDKVSSGQVVYYPNCQYEFGQGHKFSSLDGSESYDVVVKEKFINGVLGQCLIPSQNPVKFPVDKGVKLLTPNDIYTIFNDKSRKTALKGKNYVVLGGGKTAMDTVMYLQKGMKVKPEKISWVIPNDEWVTCFESPWAKPNAMVEFNHDEEKAIEALEERGAFLRVDKNVKPTKNRDSVLTPKQLSLLRKIKNVIRKGRVSSIQVSDHQAENKKVIVTFDKSNEDPTESFTPADDYIFVHCTSSGPYNNADVKEIFVSDEEIDLYYIYAPPLGISNSSLAFLEAARKRGSIDMDLGKKLLMAMYDEKSNESEDHISVNDVLKATILPFYIHRKVEDYRTFINLAVFLAIGDCDPMVTYKWITNNRLSLFSIPGFKCHIFEKLEKMVEKGETFGFTREQIEMLRLLKDKLEPLKGK